MDIMALAREVNFQYGAAIGGVVGIVVGFLAGKFAPTGSCGCSEHRPHKSSGDCIEIYVGNLSYDMTEEHMRKAFAKYGEVKSARIITNRFNNKSKGFGFVEMPHRPEAEAAIKALHDADVLGRKLRVNEARNYDKRGD